MKIVQLTPGLYVEPDQDPAQFYRNGRWMSAVALSGQVQHHGHELVLADTDVVTADALAELVTGADVVVIAPQSNPQPEDESATRALADAVVGTVNAHAPGAHVVLVSHFLVGHGRQHANAKPGTWALHEFERAVRESSTTWTILRPTWLSLENDVDAYSVYATQSPVADGLVSALGVADAILAAVADRTASHGTTSALYAAVPTVQGQPQRPDFSVLRKDLEAALQAVVS